MGITGVNLCIAAIVGIIGWIHGTADVGLMIFIPMTNYGLYKLIMSC